MLRHSDIWQAIDRLAEVNGLSTSGLAREAGLDPTTFNRSKRATPQGKLRWPSTESISKVLEATSTPLGNFLALVGESNALTLGNTIPLIGNVQAGEAGYFDDAGYPVGSGWDEVQFPETPDPHCYALEISGDSMMPLYREGDIIVVSPGTDVRRGDRVVVRTKAGEVTAKQLLRQTANRVDLRSLNPEHEDRSILLEDIDWMARIIWVSQ